jgi:hypothetical protein
MCRSKLTPPHMSLFEDERKNVRESILREAIVQAGRRGRNAVREGMLRNSLRQVQG